MKNNWKIIEKKLNKIKKIERKVQIERGNKSPKREGK